MKSMLSKAIKIIGPWIYLYIYKTYKQDLRAGFARLHVITRAWKATSLKSGSFFFLGSKCASTALIGCGTMSWRQADQCGVCWRSGKIPSSQTGGYRFNPWPLVISLPDICAPDMHCLRMSRTCCESFVFYRIWVQITGNKTAGQGSNKSRSHKLIRQPCVLQNFVLWLRKSVQ